MAWGCVLSALAATVGAWAAGRRGRVVAAALLLSLAGVALRANLAERHWLSDWDERYTPSSAATPSTTPCARA